MVAHARRIHIVSVSSVLTSCFASPHFFSFIQRKNWIERRKRMAHKRYFFFILSFVGVASHMISTLATIWYILSVYLCYLLVTTEKWIDKISKKSGREEKWTKKNERTHNFYVCSVCDVIRSGTRQQKHRKCYIVAWSVIHEYKY